MATCPAGHASADDQFCEVCGLPIGAAPIFPPDAAPVTVPGAAPTVNPAATPGELCPNCRTPRTGNFCESCRYDYTSAAGPDSLDPVLYRSAPPLTGPFPSPVTLAPAGAPTQLEPVGAGPTGAGPVAAEPVKPGPAVGAEWSALVTANRAYYDAVQAAGGPDAASIAFPAYFPQRRFRLAGTEMRIGRHSASSGIDPEIDLSVPPADPGVSRLHAVLLKGTDGGWSVVDPGSANGTAVNGNEIPLNQPVPLRDGDRIHLGAWTELRVVRGS